MVEKHVVVVSADAPPKNTPESLQTAKYLSTLADAFRVTLVTSSGVGGWAPADASLDRRLGGSVARIDVALPERRALGALKRRLDTAWLEPDVEVTWTLRARKVASRLRDVHGIYSRAMPHSSSLMARSLARLLRVPWVMHLSDPWVENPYARLAGSNLRRASLLERRCVEDATLVSLTSEGARASYARRYPEHAHKLSVFPNVYSERDIAAEAPPADGPLVIVHTGRLYGPRNPRAFLRALALLRERHPELARAIRAVFAGFADEESERLLRDPASGVEFLGPIDFDASLRLQRTAHVLLSIDAEVEDASFGVFFPSKLLDYFASRRVVLALTAAGSTTEMAMRAASGVCHRHADAEGIVESLRRFATAHRDGRAAELAVSRPPEEYSDRFQGRRLASLIERL